MRWANWLPPPFPPRCCSPVALEPRRAVRVESPKPRELLPASERLGRGLEGGARGFTAACFIPGPSNRSPPATFKSPKATISETCWRVLVHVLKHVYIARGDLRGHRFRKRDNVVCQVPDGQVETEAGAPWGDGGKRTRHAPLTLISILVVRLFPRFINQPTNRTLYGK